ncbi:MAG: portal protein [Chaetfec virus UA24_144]|nr:MAG: portal protein [Chaetfec virus UA24_144]
MARKFSERIKNAWNVFRYEERESAQSHYFKMGPAYSYRPDRPRLAIYNERTIISSIYNRIAIDVAAVRIRHVRRNANGHFLETIDSPLDQCLTTSANLDQTGRAFVQDLAISLFDEGSVAIVPVETSVSPVNTAAFDVLSMRVGRIVEWYPDSVRVSTYNEWKGQREEIVLPKASVAIVENPLYSVMNEPNSTLRRLTHKLALLDQVDEQSSAGKLDVIIQLPYTIKSEARQAQAEKRRKQIEMQLEGTKYGIAYIDGTEKVTQLNRPAENNLMTQIESLTALLYSQLGLTKEVFEGTADEKTMLNYFNRTVEPIVAAICDAMARSFLTKTARTQGQDIMYFNDPFKLVPVSELADIADRFTRNEIMSSNEMRAIMGMRPVDDPRADELRNKNLNAANDQLPTEADEEVSEEADEEITGNYEQSIYDLDSLDAELDKLEQELGEDE